LNQNQFTSSNGSPTSKSPLNQNQFSSSSSSPSSRTPTNHELTPPRAATSNGVWSRQNGSPNSTSSSGGPESSSFESVNRVSVPAVENVNGNNGSLSQQQLNNNNNSSDNIRLAWIVNVSYVNTDLNYFQVGRSL